MLICNPRILHYSSAIPQVTTLESQRQLQPIQVLGLRERRGRGQEEYSQGMRLNASQRYGNGDKRKKKHATRGHQGWSRGGLGFPAARPSPAAHTRGCPGSSGTSCPHLSPQRISLPRGPGSVLPPPGGTTGASPAPSRLLLSPAARPWRGRARDPPAPRCGPLGPSGAA